MIIKEVNLETVCGYTSKTAGQPKTGNCVCRKIKCRKIISDQCVDEQKVVSKDICTTGKDTDH